jgi:hypothetical protein
MDETYRMLGRERTADFEREAVARRLAAEARQEGTKPGSASHSEGKPRQASLRARVVSFLLAPARRPEARDAL